MWHSLRTTLFPYTTLFRSRMGLPMAANLAAAGHTLTVWNRSPEKARRFAAEHGARAAASPAEAVAEDRKSTRLNSSHVETSYDVFWSKKNTGCSSFHRYAE